MNCFECKSKLNEYTDNELDSKLNDEISLHLEQCPSCQLEYEFLKEIIEKANELNTDPPEELKDKVLKQINAKEKQRKIISFRKIATSIASTAAIITILFVAYNSLFRSVKTINSTDNGATNKAVYDNAVQSNNSLQESQKNAVAQKEEFSGANATSSSASTSASALASASATMDKSAMLTPQSQSSNSIVEYKYEAEFTGKNIENISSIIELIPLQTNNNLNEYKTILPIKELQEKLLTNGFTLSSLKEQDSTKYSLTNSAEYGIIKIIIN